MHPDLVQRIVDHAWRHRQCLKSARGAAAVVFKDRSARLLGVEVNGPPRDRSCGVACRSSGRCREFARHAEARLVAASFGAASFDVVHVKVADGALVPSGPPSCLPCAATMLASGRVSGIWLFHDAGWTRYGADDFYDATLAHHGLAELRRA